MLLGIWSMIPTYEERAANRIEVDDMQLKDSPVSNHGNNKTWEMTSPSSSRAQATPFTPRTLAFNTLDRQLPLRADPRYPPPPPSSMKRGRFA